MIDLHFWPTPNGFKVTILFEEIKRLDPSFDYRIVPCSIGTGDQFREEFLAINPNHRMPAMVDHQPAGSVNDVAPISVFESGAIMLYVAEKTGHFWPSEMAERYRMMEWVMWQMANQGPKFGEAGHYRRLDESSGDQSYAKRRYGDEVNRLYGVMNMQLYRSRYLGGEDYGLADMIAYPWCTYLEAQGENIDDFPHFKRWWLELSERPGLLAGMDVGSDMKVDITGMSDQQLKEMVAMMYNQRARPVPEK